MEKIKQTNKNSIFLIKKTILVVDDEEINLDIMSSILKDDFNVLTAKDGKEALDILYKQEEKIDLVLLDIFMPMDGREVLKVRQSDPFLRSVPFIVCTSDKNIEEEKKEELINNKQKPKKIIEKKKLQNSKKNLNPKKSKHRKNEN